jgi:amino acid adenylation domain-containing protein
LSKVIKQLRNELAGDKTGSGVFLHLADLLEHYGRIAPARKAILAPGYSPITYGTLWGRANEMVRGLRSLGVRRSDRVAVVLPDGPETVVAIIAVAAGAVCVPLNPAFTADELHRYLADLRIAALLTRGDMGSASRGVAHALGIPVIDLSRGMDKGPGGLGLTGPATQRASDLDPARRDDDAFILVTSGTTSRPKMVPLTHVSVCLSAYNVGVALALGPRDRLLSVLPMFHGHGLISGVLASLAAGSSVICTPAFDGAAFFSWLTEFRPSWYTAVPALHRAVLSAGGSHNVRTQRSSLRLIRSASSSLPLAVLSGLEDLFGVPVIDTYGMTEAATQIAANPLGRRKPGSVGKPAGPDVAIMDVNGRRVPTGKRGEIVLRGPTITRGYDNNAAATASAFRDGWFRTGDIGYLDREGYLFIVGRIKDVINRGGQEVAPAEVEETLLRHPDVVDAVAFSIPHRRLGADVAAAVVLRPDAKVSEHKLRAFTRERLAGFKVPGLIRIVPEIPRGPGGKIKRSGIADALSMTPPIAQVVRGGKAAPPRSELERQLAETWGDLLEVDQIDVDQDVFALGADSLTVTQMLSRLRTSFGIKLSFKEIFDAPTVTALANLLQSFEREATAESIGLDDTPTDGCSGCLSFQQQRIYVLSGLDPTGYNYHVVDVARLSGPLDLDALEASFGMICERHEVLRSVFFERLGEPMQAVRAAWPRLERLDLRPCAKSGRAASIQRQAQELLRHRFEIEKELPLRAQLLQLDEDDHALAIKVHHLVTDGWSQRLFWEELEAFYAAALNGASAKLPELPIQYRHFAEWQRAWLRTRAAEEQLGYWRAQLEGLTELPLRTDRSRPRMWTGRGTRHPVELSIRLSRRIKSLSRAHGATLFMTLLAAFQCLLYRYTQHEDIAVGSLIANRNQIQLERLMGMFANTIVLRTDLTGNPSFSEVLRRVRQVTLDAYRNQDLPIEEILKVLRVSRNTDRNTLFQVMFILQNASPRVPKLPELSVQFVDVDPGAARFDLLLELIDAEERLAGWLEYSTDLFEAPTIARMAAHFRTLLEAIVANPEEQISRLPLLSEGESKRILIDWNQTRTGFGRFHTFFERFARQAKRTPGATAVSTTRVRLSYRELARRASAIADRLALEGVGPDVVVILLVERDVDFLAAMIAVHQAGGAFLPLDPAFPAARLAQIVQHSRAPLVLAGEDIAIPLKEALSGMPAQRRPRILSLEQLAQTMPRRPARLVPPGPSSLAYVIYTSGSTGVPKGAMVEQRGLFNHLCSQIFDLQLSASDVVAQTAPQSFVIAVWQFLSPLMVGARAHICDDEVARDPALLAQEIGREGVTVLQIVPALLRSILERPPNEHALRMLSRLRWLMCCGEPLAPDLLQDWFRHFPNVPVINAYGSTEVSDDVATHHLWAPTKSLATVPIGRPIANTRLYVLDAHLQPMPIGVAGELFVGGIGVGRGYLGDPEQTRRRFIRDPFSKSRTARLYRTGDAGRWRGDRTLEFLGRLDHQVKVRGCRIELGEIEHVLSGHSDIQAAIVLLRDDLAGEERLVAHIVAAAGGQPEVNELRDFLKTKLPDYMIPAGFIFLERMPLTAHGKVDRRALVATSRQLTVAASEFVAPRNTVEQILADIWALLLGIDQVGVFDNFFDLGGHSLLAGQVLARVANALGVSLPIKALFEAPTVEALARQVDKARETQPNDTSLEIPLEGVGPPPVSIVQEHLLRIEREVPGLPQFTLPFAYRLQGALDIPALERSLTEVVRRHDSLRTRFAWVDERPVALVAQPSEIGPFLVVEDLAAGTKNNHAKALLLKKAKLRAEQEAWTPFDLTRAPLFRTRLLRLDADDHILLLILHHIIVDGWSIGIFLDEVSELYLAFVGGQQAQLSEAVLQFSDFARWQRWWCTTDGAARELAYWKECLRQASAIFPPNGDRRGAQLSWRVAHEPVDLPNDLVARLSALSRRQDGTLFMTLLAGFKALLMARSGRNDICVATPMANRTQLRTERVIGPLANTTLIRTQINADMSFEEALLCVRDSVLNAYARQGLPFDILAGRLEEDALDAASLTQVFFDLRNAFRRPFKLPDVAVGSFGDIHREGQPRLPIDHTWLTVTLKEAPSGITGSWSYKKDLFEANNQKHWIADYKMILTKAAANPETPVGRLIGR